MSYATTLCVAIVIGLALLNRLMSAISEEVRELMNSRQVDLTKR